MSLPLNGVRVLDLSNVLAGPFCGYHLARLGAEVIKIENPKGGDLARRLGADAQRAERLQGLSFVAVNAGKQSVALDLKSEAGRDVFLRMVDQADVLLENFRPNVMKRLGLGFEVLSARNPRLVYCAISGFGEETAYPERPAFDAVVQAMSGLMDLTRGDGTPYKAGISAADLGGGQVALLAVLAALLQRDRSGQGQMIDLSMQDAACWMTQGAWNAPGRAQPAAPARAATIADAATHPHTTARGVLFERRDDAGKRWYMLGPPARLSATPMALPDPAAGLLDWDAFAAAGLWRR